MQTHPLRIPCQQAESFQRLGVRQYPRLEAFSNPAATFREQTNLGVLSDEERWGIICGLIQLGLMGVCVGCRVCADGTVTLEGVR
jgi:hypothetical protein